MNRKKLYALLAAESAFIILLDALTVSVPDSFTSVWNFPFEQIGAGLLALHDLGSVGAGMACALWIGLSFLLAVPAVCGRGKTPWERVLLILFAASVCVTLYVMMNPIKLMTPYDETGSFVKLIFSMMTWSVLVLYFIVRIVRLLREGDRDKLTGYFKTALYALAMLCAANIVLYGVSTVRMNSAAAIGGLDALFSLLLFAANKLPYALDIVIIIYIGELMDAAWGGNAELLPQRAERLTGMCCSTLIATAALSAGFNVLQVLFLDSLSHVVTTMQIPVFSIAFTLFTLLFTRIVVENRDLRDDNELFI
ncbi:MAG: hypothetical protein SOY36_01440 [Oscillospiraceae bacterium]|nr:hypothetical protein [Oscillospiraceae bacterium]